MSDNGVARHESDEALLMSYAAGDSDAARLLMDRYASRLLRFATGMLGNPVHAEDVVQEAMLRLWRQAPTWRHGSARISTWLWRVASNLCIDKLRQRQFANIDALRDLDDGRPSSCQRLLDATRVEALHDAMAHLPERQRIAVSLRHIEELPNPRIAEIMGVSIESVESLVARGVRGLKARLAERKEELGWRD